LGLPLSNDVPIKGTLYQKIEKQLVKKRRFKTLKVFQDFISEGGAIFSALDAVNTKKCTSLSCFPYKMKSENSVVSFQRKLAHDFMLDVEFSRLRDGQYSTVTMSAHQTGAKDGLVNMKLIVDKCE
jgi:hypothetical protein